MGIPTVNGLFRLFFTGWIHYWVTAVPIILYGQAPIEKENFTPEVNILRTSIINFYTKKTESEVEIYKTKIRAKWVNYLPAPGWNFATGSPILTLNFSDLGKAINARQIQKATVKSVIRANEVLLNSAWSDIILSREILNNKIDAYNASFTLLNLHESKFEIVRKGYEQSEITPTEYLSAQFTLENFKNDLRKEYSNLFQLRNELLIKAKKGDGLSLSDVQLFNINSFKSK